MITLPFIRRVAIVATLCLTIIIGGAGAEEASSANDERLKRALERFPQADADKDGVLTAGEAQAFRPKFEGFRRKLQPTIRRRF